jgi:hypothetical protein
VYQIDRWIIALAWYKVRILVAAFEYVDLFLRL